MSIAGLPHERKFVMSQWNNNDIEKKLSMIGNIEPSQKNADKAVENVRQMLLGSKSGQKSSFGAIKLTVLFPFFRYAAAAVILIVVLIGVSLFHGPLQSITLAGVSEKLDTISGFQYKAELSTRMNFMPVLPGGIGGKINSVITISQYGLKIQTDMRGTGDLTQVTYFLPDEGQIYNVMPAHKQFMVTDFDEQVFESVKSHINDPRHIVKQMQKCKSRNLGRKKINGILAEGFETIDQDYAGGRFSDIKLTLWVDVDNWLPVKADINFVIGSNFKIKWAISDFNWDVPINAQAFAPVIPDDYLQLELREASESTVVMGQENGYSSRFKNSRLGGLISTLLDFQKAEQGPQDQAKKTNEYKKKESIMQTICFYHMMLIHML